MSRRKILSLCCSLGLATHLFAGDELSSEDKARYKAEAKKIIQRASLYYEAHGVPFPVDDSMEFTLRQRQHSLVGREYILVKTPIAVIWLMKPTGEFYTFMHRKLVGMNPKPDAATRKWTNEEAEKMARQFIIALMGSMPENLEAKPIISYSPGVYGKSMACGEWTLYWTRVDKHGRTFLNDGIKVNLKDGVAADGMAVNMWSKHDEGDFEPIPKEKALELAKKGAKKITTWKGAKGWLRGFSLVSEEAKAELQIANPNDGFLKKSEPSDMTQISSTARLAWVVDYPIRYTGPEREDGSIPLVGTGVLQVWIDAENGKFLGGRF